MHLVIIGNSAAGLAAACTVRKLEPAAQITVISGEPGPAYARCLIPELLAGRKDMQGILYVNEDFYRENEITLLSGKKVTSLDAEGRKVCFAGGGVIGYDRLLVATGASPVMPQWPGAGLPGVFTLRRADHALAAGNLAAKTKSAVVAGGGLVSLKAACALKQRGVKDVIVVIKSPHLLIKQLNEKGAALLEKELTGSGIKFIYGNDLSAVVEGPGGAVQAVQLEDGQLLHAGLVLVGKGVRPNKELVQQAGGKVDAGIVVDNYLQTSLPGVYAAGDCIEVQDAVTGEKTNSGLWPLAVEQGRCAGYNLAGRARIYQPPLTRLNAGRFGAVSFVSVGDIKGAGEAVAISEKGCYRKVCFTDGRLVGFIMVGSVERAGVYTALIKKARPLGRLKDKVINGTVTGADLAGFN